MDCAAVRWLSNLQRREPGQLDAVESAALRHHVEHCPACQAWRETEVRVDAAFASALVELPVPAGLESRILGKLAMVRSPRRWVPLAAAALLFLVAGSGYWFASRPIPVDLSAYSQLVDYQSQADPETVQEHFAVLGHPMTPPSQFNYKLLVRYELARFQGREVPRLTFQNGGVVGHVYVLPLGRFTLPPEADQLPNLHVFRGEDCIYIVDCPGGQLAALLNAVT